MRLGARTPTRSTDDPREFLNKPRWQRILVYLAGPAMNIVLAIGLFAGLFMVGIEVTNLPDMPPLVGAVEQGSSAAPGGPAARATCIVEIKGEPVSTGRT